MNRDVKIHADVLYDGIMVFYDKLKEGQRTGQLNTSASEGAIVAIDAVVEILDAYVKIVKEQ